MANTANLSLGVTASLTVGDKSYVPAGITLSSAVGQFSVANLGSGDTTVTPPVGTTMAVVVIPATTVTMKIKGVAGDTGITIIANSAAPRWVVLPLVSATF